jgi:hypothetical protein
MKRNILILLSLGFLLRFADASSVEISVGGAFTGYIPTINYYSYEYITPVVRTYTENLNLLFGLAVSIPVSVNYNFNSGWGIGGCFETGFSFQAGPQLYSRYAPSDYVPTDFVYIYNAFYGIFDMMVKSPRNRYGMRAVMEFGLVIRPGALIGFNRTGRLRFYEGPGSDDFRFLFYAGPNFFIGFQKEVARSVIITPGIRFSGEFSVHQYDYNRYAQNEFYVQANIALEVKILWNKFIALPAPGNDTKTYKPKTRTTPKKKTKPKVEEEYK